MEKPIINIVSSTFEEIYPIWNEKLWPGRQSIIEPQSMINDTGQIDSLLVNSPVFFWKALTNSKIVGVISAQITSESIRSRGLWISHQARNLGIGSALIQKVVNKGIASQSKLVWTMCRQTAWPVYEKNGFRIVKEITIYEFGPHYLAHQLLVN